MMYRIYVDNSSLEYIVTEGGHLKAKPYKTLRDAWAALERYLDKVPNCKFQIIKDR